MCFIISEEKVFVIISYRNVANSNGLEVKLIIISLTGIFNSTIVRFKNVIFTSKFLNVHLISVFVMFFDIFDNFLFSITKLL